MARPWVSFIAMAFLACLPVGSLEAQPRISEQLTLRIASWSLGDAADAGVIAAEKPVTRSWRNTFGAERRVAARPKFAADRLKADIVLIQGVSNVRQVSQIFPARKWRLIFSKELLSLSNGRLSQDTTIAGSRSITAVAVRYQRQVRVTAIEHLDELGGNGNQTASNNGDEFGAIPGGPQASTPSNPAKAGVAAAVRSPSGLALRISYSGSTIWVVSASLPSRCREGPPICQQAASLKDWADEKRRQGVGIVIGGQLAEVLRAAGPSGLCSDQEIIVDRELGGKTGADTVAGCVAFADVTSAP